MEFKCTCSRERCADALKTLPDEEVDSILAEDGEIDMHCDYCGNHYLFNAMDIAEIRNNASPADPQVLNEYVRQRGLCRILRLIHLMRFVTHSDSHSAFHHPLQDRATL